MKEKFKYIKIYLIIILAGLFFLSTIREGHDWGGDFSMYIQHAKNIAEGKPYSLSGYIYNPDSPETGPQNYPPIFPIMLSPLIYFFGMNLKVMKIFEIICFSGTLVLMLSIFREHLRFRFLALFIAIIAFNPYFWEFKDNILSDYLFLFLLFLNFYLFKNCTDNPSLRKLKPMLFGLALYLLIGTRTVGISFIIFVLVADIIKFNKIQLSNSISILICGILFIMQTMLVAKGGGYVDQVHNIYLNTINSVITLKYLWSNAKIPLVDNAFLLTFIILTISGIIRCLLKKHYQFLLFTVIYLSIIIIWPSFQGMRLLIPVIPFLIYYAVKSLEFFRSEVTTFAVLLVILFSYCWNFANKDFGAIKEGIHKKETNELFVFIKQKTGTNDVFIFRKPRVLSLYTGRRSAIYYLDKGFSHLMDYSRSINAKYLITSSEDVQKLQSFVNEYHNHFAEIYRNSSFTVYQIEY